MKPLKEKVTMMIPISASDAIAQLSDATGLDDQQLIDKMPCLKDFKGLVMLQYSWLHTGIHLHLHSTKILYSIYYVGNDLLVEGGSIS